MARTGCPLARTRRHSAAGAEIAVVATAIQRDRRPRLRAGRARVQLAGQAGGSIRRGHRKGSLGGWTVARPGISRSQERRQLDAPQAAGDEAQPDSASPRDRRPTSPVDARWNPDLRLWIPGSVSTCSRLVAGSARTERDRHASHGANRPLLLAASEPARSLATAGLG